MIRELFLCVAQSKAKFRRRSSHEPNRMQMRKILCSPSLAFDSAHVKYGVWTWPKWQNSITSDPISVWRHDVWTLVRPGEPQKLFISVHLYLKIGSQCVAYENWAAAMESWHIISICSLIEFPRRSWTPFLRRIEALETSASESLYGGQFTLSTRLIKPNYLAKHQNFHVARPWHRPSGPPYFEFGVYLSHKK